MDNFKIGVVIPVYNHPQVLEKLIEHVLSLSLPMILVDDGSDEATAQLMVQLHQRHSPHIHLLRHPSNLGKGAAVKTGLLAAQQLRWSHALQLDADGQHHWPDMARFVHRAKQDPEHMIIGKPVYDQTVSKTRLYGRYATHVWVWINTLSKDIHDSMCGFRVYPLAPTCALLRQHTMQARMGFDSEILVHLHWAGVRFINLPTPVTYPANGISHFLLWEDNVGLSRMHAKMFAGMLWRLPKLLKQRWGKA